MSLLVLAVLILGPEPPRIDAILFSGNNSIPAREIHASMELRAASLATLWSDRERLDAARLERDLEKIRTLYRRRGFFTVEVGPARSDEIAPGKVRLTIPIREGEIFSWGRLTVDPGTATTEAEVRSALERPDSAPYDAVSVREAASAIERRLQDRGYPGARVELIEIGDPARLVVDLRVRVDAGPLSQVGRIEFRGHRVSSEQQLRQYVTFEESQLFRLSAVERSAALLGSLGSFRHVRPSYVLRPEASRVDVLFDLEETPRVQYFAGGSVSGATGGSANLTLRVKSPWGWGETWQMSGDLGNRLQDLAFAYENPFFPGRRFTTTTAFALRRIDHPDGTGDDETSLSLGVAGPRGSPRVFRVGFSYGAFKLSSDLEGTVPFLTEFLGQRFDTRRLRASVSFDGRDRFVFSTRGSVALAGIEAAGGPFGGCLSVLRARAQASRIQPLGRRSRHLVMLGARWERVWPYGETLDEGLPRFERLFLGGEEDLRGFPVRGVGPQDPDGIVVGGDELAYASAEYDYVLASWIRAASFFDMGNTWASDYAASPVSALRYDAGVEIQVQAPFLGLPLRAGYGFNLNRLPGDARGRFFFALSARF